MLRLRQHIQYAAGKGILNIVDQYLRNLAQGDWYFFGNLKHFFSFASI